MLRRGISKTHFKIVMAKKQIRIGLIGYGFMGRAHSNAFAKVGHFFDSGHELVMQEIGRAHV